MKNNLVKGGARGLTGIAIAVGGVMLATMLLNTEVPETTRPVPSITVNTVGTSNQTVVCQGSFGVLGLNVSSPNDVTPIESTDMTLSGDATSRALEQDIPGATPPAAHTVPGGETIRAAQTQVVRAETAQGRVASACSEPTNEQWLVGGSTKRGVSSIITVSNPGAVPATIALTVYDEGGVVEGVGTTGVLVPAGAQKTVPLNGFGPGREATAVLVQSSGSPVVATLGVHEIADILPIGADTVNAQLAASTTLVFPGVKNFSDHSHSDDEHHEDEFPVVARILATDASTTVRVLGLNPSGDTVELGEVEVTEGVVTDTPLAHVPDSVTAILFESDEPVVGAVSTSVHKNDSHDFTWMTPATKFQPVSGVAESLTTTVKGGKLTLVNLGGAEAEFTVGDKQVTLKPLAAREVSGGASTLISGPQPFAAGVLLFDEQSIATYPILGSVTGLEEFTVYPR